MMPTSESARQGSNRSEVWKYFTETVGGAKCKICGQIRVRSDKSTKTMHDHLRTAHKDVSYQKAYPNRKPQRLVPSVRPPKSVSESKSAIISTATTQSRKSDIEADRHILYFILRCMADFDTILQAPELSTLIQAVYPSYKLKNRVHYGSVVSEREASRINGQLGPQMQDSFFSLTADWLSSENAELVTFSSHHLSEQYAEQSGIVLAEAFGPSTSELDVAERLRNRLRDLHVDMNKLVAVVHNGDFCNVSRILSVHSFECGARLISRVMVDALSVECVNLMVSRARQLIENFKRFNKTKTFFNERLVRDDGNWVRICNMFHCLVAHSDTLNLLAEELPRKEAGTRMALDEEEAVVFNQLSIILLTFKEEAVRLSRDSASAYYPTFLKLKAFIDCFAFAPGGVVEVFVGSVREQIARICDTIRANKFLVLCTVLDPRFRNRIDYQHLPWAEIESDFLDFAVTCALKDPRSFERRAAAEQEGANNNQNFDQIMEMLMQNVGPTQQPPPPQAALPERQPLTTGSSHNAAQITEERASPTKAEPIDEPEPIDVVSAPARGLHPNLLGADGEAEEPRAKLRHRPAVSVDIWRAAPAVREEHNLNFRLSFSVSLRCELDQFAKMESVERASSLRDWWNAHSADFPRLRKFARILHSIPATAVSAEHLFGGEPTFYATKLLKWFGSKSTANCLLIKSSLGAFKRLPPELELNQPDSDL